jgi:Skp family chaperone for outer membrane proteins
MQNRGTGAGEPVARFLRLVLIALCVLAMPAISFAQTDLSVGIPRSPLLTIDPDRLFSQSQYGLRIQQELRQKTTELATENRQIETELEAEELALTEQRPRLTLEDFRALADDFDLKVSSMRNRQDGKTRALQRLRDRERQTFLTNALPMLSDIMRESGAVAIIESRSVFVTADQIDITDIAIARMDATLGDGSVLRSLPATAPEPRPEPEPVTEE